MTEAEETADQIGESSNDADFDTTPAEEPTKEKDS
jgi:hypothetical protein